MGMTTGIVTKRKVQNLWKASKKKESILWSLRMSNPRSVLETIGSERPDYMLRMRNAPEGKDFLYSRKYPNPPINQQQLRFDTVKKIELIGKLPVYDLMIENSHNFIADNIIVHNSIMVDDIEDASDLRRGKPSTHKLFGVDVAVNAGNFMYFLAFFPLIKNRDRFTEKTILRAWEVVLEETTRIHYGQGTDIAWHRGLADADSVSETEYLQMCAYKTGVLARLAARLAVILNDGSAELEQKLGRFSESIGVAFQIQDDIMNVCPPEGWGKETGDDINEGKRTLLVIHTLQKADKGDRKRLIEILGMHTKDQKTIKEAIDIMKRHGSVEYAKEYARKMVRDAWAAVQPLLPENAAKGRIKDFADFLVEREI